LRKQGLFLLCGPFAHAPLQSRCAATTSCNLSVFPRYGNPAQLCYKIYKNQAINRIN
jgi:hypothetical protein